MHSLKDVNALATGQTIKFALEGLTVVYGENGAGKTGYSRVLRRACRQWREKDVEGIRPNVRTPSPGVPEATFDVAVGDQRRSVTWRQGAKAPAELAGLAVFDTRCVPAIIAEENAVTYQPEELRLMPRFGDVLTAVSGQVGREVAGLRVVPEVIARVPRVGSVDAFLKRLEAGTDVAALDEVVGDVDATKRRLEEVTADLAQLASKDGPEAQAKVREALRGRCERLRLRLQQSASLLDDAAASTLRKAAEDLRVAQEASRLASEQRFDDAYLPGTGAQAWRHLYEAAKAYSLVAYPGRAFPVLDQGAKCPWCQQALADEAKERARRFRAFVEDRTAVVAREAASKLATLVRPLEEEQMPVLDADLVESIRERNADLAASLVGVPAAFSARRAALLAAVEKGGWEASPKWEQPGSVAALASMEGEFAREAAAKREMIVPGRREALMSERDALEARMALHGVRDAVRTHLKHLGQARALMQALGDCETRSLTLENSRRTQQSVTQGFANALSDEIKRLGADGYMQVELKTRGERGQTLNQLVLSGTNISKGAVLHVLSEGEQRVLAVAAFLAELSLAVDKVGVIFDDPVTSLDHRWSERFARRIVDLASDRQVVIFTHDISFYMSLHDEAAEQQIPFHPVFVARLGGVPGHCTGQPWETMDLKKRLAYVDAQCQELQAAYSENESGERYLTLVGRAVDLLRSCWERAVEEELLAEVVMRFRSGIETKRLRYVTVDDDLFKRVNDGMTRTSGMTPAHDRAARRPVAPPTPQDVSAELQALRDFANLVGERQKPAERSRISLMKPPVPVLAD